MYRKHRPWLAAVLACAMGAAGCSGAAPGPEALSSAPIGGPAGNLPGPPTGSSSEGSAGGFVNGPPPFTLTAAPMLLGPPRTTGGFAPVSTGPDAAASGNLPGPPPGTASLPSATLPGETVDDAAGAPFEPGPLTAVDDRTKPDVPNVAFFDFRSRTNADTSPIRHDFHLRNDGPTPLVIARVQPSCDCVDASVDSVDPGAPATIVPGAPLTVHVTVDAGLLYVGTINKIVWLYLAGQSGPAYTLHVMGTVRPCATFQPSLLDFGSVSAGSKTALTFEVSTDISVYGKNPPAPSCASGRVSVVRAARRQRMAGGMITRTYSVRLAPHADLGPLSELLALPRAGGMAAGPAVLVSGTIVGNAKAP